MSRRKNHVSQAAEETANTVTERGAAVLEQALEALAPLLGTASERAEEARKHVSPYADNARIRIAPLADTAKERLSGKDSDEQRVDDCKVPPERRTRPRPTACPWDFGS